MARTTHTNKHGSHIDRTERQFPIPQHNAPLQYPPLPPYGPYAVLYKDSSSSDTTLFYGPHGFQCFEAHRHVLCGMSPWFANILHDSQPNARHLFLQVSDPAAIEAFLEFCYLGRYAEPTDPYYNADVAKATFEFHARVFMVAHRYAVTGLANVALGKMRGLLDGCEVQLGEEQADVWEWAVECVYLHGDVLGVSEEGGEVERSLTLREKLDQHARQPSVHDAAIAANEVGRRLSACALLEAVIVEAAVEVCRANQNYRLLRRFARVAKDVQSFGSDVASAILDPGP